MIIIKELSKKNIKYENEILKLKRGNENLKSNINNIETENIARNDLVLKLFKTKVNLLRNQIYNIKEQSQRDLLNIKNETQKNFEIFTEKFNHYIKELLKKNQVKKLKKNHLKKLKKNQVKTLKKNQVKKLKKNQVKTLKKN